MPSKPAAQRPTWTAVPLSTEVKVEAKLPVTLKNRLELTFEDILTWGLNFEPSLTPAITLSGGSAKPNLCFDVKGGFEITDDVSLGFKIFGKEHQLAQWKDKTPLYKSADWEVYGPKCWKKQGGKSDESDSDSDESDSEDESDPSDAEDEDAEDDTPVQPPVQPSLSPEQCHTCLTMCNPCKDCTSGPDGMFAYGSCTKCWHCWDWDDDELEDDDKDMDEDCDALHEDHDWSDEEVRCLTNDGQDCRACYDPSASLV